MQLEKKRRATTREILGIYWAATKPHWPLLAVVLFGMLLLQVGMLIAPWFLRQFFNTLATGVPDAAAVAQLVFLLVVITAMWLVEWLGRRIQDLANMVLQARVMRNLLAQA